MQQLGLFMEQDQVIREGCQVTIRNPGSQYYGYSGIILNISNGICDIELNGAIVPILEAEINPPAPKKQKGRIAKDGTYCPDYEALLAIQNKRIRILEGVVWNLLDRGADEDWQSAREVVNYSK